MKRFCLLSILFLVTLGVSQSFSQETEDPKALTLEECIQIALKNRPELEVSSMDILQSEQQVKEAQSYYYPRLNLTAGYTRFNDPLTIDAVVDVSAITGPANDFLNQFGVKLPEYIAQEFPVGKVNWWAAIVDLQQPIYTFGRISEGVKQAEIGHSIAVNQKGKKRDEIIAEVKKGYYQFLLSREILQLLNEGEKGSDVVAKMVKIAYETSIPEKEEKGTTRLDYLKARNFQSEVRARLSEARKNFKLAGLALKLAMGLAPTAPLTLKEVPFESLPMVVLSPEELRERMLIRNPDLKSLELGIQFYDSKRKAANKEYLPRFGIQGQYIGPEDRWGTKNAWYAGIGLTMPLFDGFLTKAKIGQAEAQLRKVKTQKTVLESALSVQMEHLYTALVELKERIEILKGGIEEVKERVQLAADGFAAGITEYDELLLSQRAELEMRAVYLQCLFLHQMAKTEIEFISGIP